MSKVVQEISEQKQYTLNRGFKEKQGIFLRRISKKNDNFLIDDSNKYREREREGRREEEEIARHYKIEIYNRFTQR